MYKDLYFVSFNIIDYDENSNVVVKHTGYGLIKFKDGLDIIKEVIEIVKKEKDIDVKPDNIHIIAFNKI